MVSADMPYDRITELPRPLRLALPRDAQEIYRKTFNSAWRGYRPTPRRRRAATLEETAHRVAWAAVKSVYVKSRDGRWRRRTHRAASRASR